MKTLGLISVLVTGALLIFAVEDFPDWGAVDSPANSGEMATYFVEETASDTAVPNMVTAVLADYRGYDTMFETVVIFTAGIAILALLRSTKEDPIEAPVQPSRAEVSDSQRIIIGTTCRLLTPIIQLFALYVIAHGHYSPGGGFQGGVIFGASFILLAVAYDLPTALKRLPERRYLFLAAFGIIFYAAFGIASMALGANFLDYSILYKIFPTDPIYARSHSMLGVEIGVAFTVTTIMFATYANLSSGGKLGSRGL